jgi:hypothetical protein
VKLREQGSNESPRQLGEFHNARHAVDAIVPDGARDLRYAFVRDPQIMEQAVIRAARSR